jgi:hypothetical protein
MNFQKYVCKDFFKVFFEKYSTNNFHKVVKMQVGVAHVIPFTPFGIYNALIKDLKEFFFF